MIKAKVLRNMNFGKEIKNIEKRHEYLKKLAKNINNYRATLKPLWIADREGLTLAEQEACAENEVWRMAQEWHFTPWRTGIDPESGEMRKYYYEYDQHIDGHVMVWREEAY
jgi:hypothetical protein